MLLKNYLNENLSGKSLFITGGTGFFGKSIIDYLSKHEIKLGKLTILTRNIKNFKIANPEFNEVKIPYLNFIEQDVQKLQYNNDTYDYVIHAATSVVDKVDALQLVNEIIDGSKRVLDFASKANAKSFINVSSGAVYGKIKKLEPALESDLSTPSLESNSSSYALGKIISEYYSYLYANSSMKVTSLRCFCFAGAYLNPSVFAIGEFINKALKNEDVLVNSGSGVYRSYLSTCDLVEWMFYVLISSLHRVSNYEVYNVGSENAISLPELASFVIKTLNSKSNLLCPNIKNHGISYYVPNIDKIKQLGVESNYSLDQVIIDTADFYTKNSILYLKDSK